MTRSTLLMLLMIVYGVGDSSFYLLHTFPEYNIRFYSKSTGYKKHFKTRKEAYFGKPKFLYNCVHCMY